jgi:hypothetical protein
MLRPRGHRVLAGLGALLGAMIATGLVTGATLAAFSAQSSDAGNQLKAKPDWTPPTVSVVLVSKGSGADSYVRPTGAYRVYANVPSDGGNPPSGTGTVTANVTNLTPGTTAAPLTAGSYALNGVTYNYQSSSLTVGSSVTEGAKSFTLSATDNAGNTTSTSGTPVTVDATAPSTTDVQTINKAGGVAGKAEAGDKVVFTFSEKVEPSTILSGWDGTSINTTFHLDNQGSADRFSVYNNSDTTQTNLGTVSLGGKNYTTSTINFTGSTMAMSTAAPWTVTVTLGTTTGAPGTQTSATTMSWTPLTGITDLAGNNLPTTARSETGSADIDF